MQTELRRNSLALVGILLGIFLFTYRGAPVSTDELSMFSSTESLIKYGNLNMVSLYNINTIDWTNPSLSSVKHEPFQMLISAPLYAFAHASQSIGMLHAVWLLNSFVTALIGLMIYRIGYQLGFSHRASLSTALITCLGTSLWVYAGFYFREPLATLWILGSIYCAIRLNEDWHPRWLVWLILTVIGSMFTKVAALVVMPGLMMLLYPTWQHRPTSQKLSLVGVLGIALVIFLIAGQQMPGNYRFVIDSYRDRLEVDSADYILTVVGAYWASPGRSIWSNGPILLLSLVGAWAFYRGGRPHIGAFPFAALGGLTLGYGVGGWDWHGGVGWGTRYLLPVIPMMGLLLLPLVERAWQGTLPRPLMLFGGGLLVLSVLIQLSGILVPFLAFYNIIEVRFEGQVLEAYHEQVVWQIPSTQWYITLKELLGGHIEWTGQYSQPSWLLPLMASSLIGISLWSFRARWASLGGLALIGIAPLALLISLQDDARLLGDRKDLEALATTLENQAEDDHLILLSSPEYQNFFLNEYYGLGTLVTLPYAPGEQYSPVTPPRSAIDRDGDGFINYNERTDGSHRQAFDQIPDYEQGWLVENLSPFDTWAFRAVENYISQHYFPFWQTEFADHTRLIRYQTTYADQYTPPDLAPVAYQFGDVLRLENAAFLSEPHPGTVLPLILGWRSLAPMQVDYVMSVIVTDSQGRLVWQFDSPPQSGFSTTSEWIPHTYTRDHRGVVIPSGLPPDTYTIHVIVYDWQTLERLPLVQGPAAPLIEQAAPLLAFEVE